MRVSPGKKRKILVLGIGNYLMGDEGVGVHAVKFMQAHDFPGHVLLVDGGTGGFHLLSYLQEYDPVILLDATVEQDPPGTLRIRKPRYSADFPPTLGAHDIGLKDLVESAALLGDLPEIYLITLCIGLPDDLGTELSPALRKKLPVIEEKVREIIKIYD